MGEGGATKILKNIKNKMHIDELLKDKKFESKKDNFHEFQILGKEISNFVKKPAYFLFSKYNHDKIRDAFEIIKKKNIPDLSYMIKIIINLK